MVFGDLYLREATGLPVEVLTLTVPYPTPRVTVLVVAAGC